MMTRTQTAEKILAMSPQELTDWLTESYVRDLPLPQSSAEFQKHNHLLGELANIYSFLMALYASASVKVREAKRKKKSKDEIDDCIARRDILETFADLIKMQYSAFSRMITVQKQADDEMRMQQ